MRRLILLSERPHLGDGDGSSYFLSDPIWVIETAHPLSDPTRTMSLGHGNNNNADKKKKNNNNNLNRLTCKAAT